MEGEQEILLWHRSLDPASRSKVGDEVYAVCWADKDRKDTTLWYTMPSPSITARWSIGPNVTRREKVE